MGDNDKYCSTALVYMFHAVQIRENVLETLVGQYLLRF